MTLNGLRVFKQVRYQAQQDQFVRMLSDCSKTVDNVIVTDLTPVKTLFAGNRFLVYALYPEQNAEIRVMWGKDRQNIVFACGHSILNRTCRTDIGKLMLKYEGGGHRKVGICQVGIENWQEDLADVVEVLRANG